MDLTPPAEQGGCHLCCTVEPIEGGQRQVGGEQEVGCLHWRETENMRIVATHAPWWRLRKEIQAEAELSVPWSPLHGQDRPLKPAVKLAFCVSMGGYI